MSQALPLSTLAPEFNNRISPAQQFGLQEPCLDRNAKCNPCQPCKPTCDPCRSGYDMGYGWGWLGALILWFIIFTVLFWLIYYSLKPSFVLQTDSNQVDTAKVLLGAVISALILVILIWLIKA